MRRGPGGVEFDWKTRSGKPVDDLPIEGRVQSEGSGNHEGAETELEKLVPTMFELFLVSQRSIFFAIFPHVSVRILSRLKDKYIDNKHALAILDLVARDDMVRDSFFGDLFPGRVANGLIHRAKLYLGKDSERTGSQQGTQVPKESSVVSRSQE